jgi:hypothetical protein
MVLPGLYEFEFKQSAELITDQELGASTSTELITIGFPTSKGLKSTP